MKLSKDKQRQKKHLDRLDRLFYAKETDVIHDYVTIGDETLNRGIDGLAKMMIIAANNAKNGIFLTEDEWKRFFKQPHLPGKFFKNK
jgi:hypothetical protein